MLSFIIITLCMIPLPLAFVNRRKSPVTTGTLKLVAALDVIVGYVSGILIILLLCAIAGDTVLSGPAFGPGVVLTALIVYFLLKRHFREYGMLALFKPKPKEEIAYRPPEARKPVEPEVAPSASPVSHVPTQGHDSMESSLDLLMQVQSEAAKEQASNMPTDLVERPASRRQKIAIYVLGLSCVVLLFTCLFLAWKASEISTEANLIKDENAALEAVISRRDKTVASLNSKVVDLQSEIRALESRLSSRVSPEMQRRLDAMKASGDK